MPLKKILFKPGVNRENTRYTTEGGWYDCDKVRFRQGTPEVIGGWQRISQYTFQGICRSIWTWVTLGFASLIGVGTNLKFYIGRGGIYLDITPIRSSVTLNGPFTATNGSNVIVVTDANHGCRNGDYVTFYGATGLGGAITDITLNQEYQITYISLNSYSITVDTTATSGDTGHGGTDVQAVYQINTGPEYAVPQSGWGAGPWGFGTWGNGQPASDALRLWSQTNYGQDLVFGPRGGGIYYWNASIGPTSDPVTISNASPAKVSFSTVVDDGTAITFETTGVLPSPLLPGVVYYLQNYDSGTGTYEVASSAGGSSINTTTVGSGTQSISGRAINLADLAGASDVPVIQNYTFVSDIYRFVFAFGCNDYTTTAQNPMLIRWSDQEDAVNWTPAATNQAGSLPLSHGTKIVTAQQTRQEIVVWTDASVYSLQYVGPPYVWSATLLADNTSIIGQNAAATASGVTFWMGIDKFYKYDGRVQTMRCDLRQYIFNDINQTQAGQIFAGTNEGFNEVWWFYCSAGSTVIDKYVVYNYVEDIWYYGTMGRTAWLDSGIRDYPLAATYSSNLVNHEQGINNNETATETAINAYITSSEFDIDDGHNFGFIWRIVPDITFRGSTAGSPQATMTLYPLQSSGSGYNDPTSIGGVNYGTITRTETLPVEKFTQYLYTRVRGRQMAFKVSSDQIGTTWQLGAPRIDIKPDGRR